MKTSRSTVALVAALLTFTLCSMGWSTAWGKTWTITGGDVSVTYDDQAGTFSAFRGDRRFIKGGSFGDFLPIDKAKQCAVARSETPPGPFLVVAHPSGRKVVVRVDRDKPLIYFTAAIANLDQEPITINTITPLSAPMELGVAAKDLRTLGYDGLAPADQPKTTYMAISVANPKTRAGVVCGWLTHDRASGVAISKPKGDGVCIEARSEYGRLLVPACDVRSTGNSKILETPFADAVAGETLVLGYFDDVFQGLELYAEAIAEQYKIRVKPVPSGYMTWYHARALDEKRMPVLANWCAENLQKHGFDFLQIDDGWQLSRRDFTAHDPKGVYPGGMKPTAEAITSRGFAAGIWITPFGWDHKRPVFADHQDWFVQREDGSVYAVKWGGDSLDMSHPEARQFLHGVVDRIANDWGYKFFKLDALWAGMAAKILYPNPQYRDDSFGDAVFHDPQVTNIQAFRRGLKVVRQAAGDDAYLLGCTAAQNMRTLAGSIGLVDGIRVGRDSGRKWNGIVDNVKVSSSIYYLHGRVWHNDADVLYLDDHFTLDQVRAWASWLAISGNLYMVSNWLPDAPAERLDAIKRTIPNHNLKARPVDLYEAFPARVWHLHDGEGELRRDVVALFNWGDTEERISVDLARLGLSGGRYALFDFWEDRLERISGLATLERTLRPTSCRVIALRRLDQPLVISTSRHVTQGIVDLVQQKPENAKGGLVNLRGVSRVVGGDPYEIRTAAPDVVGPWQAREARVSAADEEAGVTIKIAQGKSSPTARIVIDSPANRDVSWQIDYIRGR